MPRDAGDTGSTLDTLQLPREDFRDPFRKVLVRPGEEALIIARTLLHLKQKNKPRNVAPFPTWLEYITPNWQWRWKHLQYVQGYLDQLSRKELNRLMIFMPPRHGKSEMVTVRYPIWRLEREPGTRVIIAAYNQILANKFSRKSLRIAESRLQLTLGRRRAVEDWETTDGGGFRAIGVGAGITGQGGNLIVIDDPVKNREEAESETVREKVWDWYRDDLYTRLEPQGQMILIMTRWHEDDLAGRILNSPGFSEWSVIKLPAFAEENDPLGRPRGAALCPDRYDEEALRHIQIIEGQNFQALYQQSPQNIEGSMFQRGHFANKFVDAAPIDAAARVRFWDKAATENGGDYTVGTLMCLDYSGRYYVEDVVRGQWSTNERDKTMYITTLMDARRYRDTTSVQVWHEEEGGSGGKDSSAATNKLLAGFDVHSVHSTGSKVVRASPFAAQCQAGNVYIVNAPWNEDWLKEMEQFPTGKYDDQVDSGAGAFNKLALMRGIDDLDPEIVEMIEEYRGW
jgi:predicted phage terminase large subunit-like protein